jgi:hypothetical protein
MSESLNLYQRIVKVMASMGAVGKSGTVSYGEKFAFHRIDDIDDKLRHALIEHGVVCTVIEIADRKLEYFVEKDRHGNERSAWYAECSITIELVNADKPEERTEIKGWGQGLDYSDKATGKAVSYASKSAYLSAFHLRGQPDNEEDNITTKPKDGSAKPKAAAELSTEAQSWVDAINQTDCIEDLNSVGENLRNEAAAVQNAARPHYAKKLKELKAKK